MNKKIILVILIISIFLTAGCNLKNNTVEKVNKEVNKSLEINININDKEYVIDLEDNETVKSLINNLPEEFKMNELNGNEKYVYLDNELPTNEINPKHINKGDVMLFGNNCFVIFYKSFKTSYSYTKIGHINNLDDLGSSSITVKIIKGRK